MAQLSLPITPVNLVKSVIRPALKLLPPAMTSTAAIFWLIVIALQESQLRHRWQVIDLARPDRKGPARGLWQFELGTKASRGGIWGVYLHDASRYWLAQVCAARGIEFTPNAIWRALETDDVFACCVARLLLFTDPYRLPAPTDNAGGWKLYRVRLWRPGKPHPETWDGNCRAATETIKTLGV